MLPPVGRTEILMNAIKINEQIAFLRKQKGLTQEELAKALGVTNQAVSKWEGAQCCPDIQLLPNIAKLFNISVDELLGYTPVSSAGDIVLDLRKRIEALPYGEDFDFTFRMAAAVHTIIFSKGMMTVDDPNTGWDTDEAIEHAGNAEWGYSCCNIPEITTIMRHGTVLFSNNKNLTLMNNIRRIVSMIKPFSDAHNLKIAAALYNLTVHSENAYATLSEISEKSGMTCETVKGCLEGELSRFIIEKEAPESRYRFDGMYMSILPVISLLDFK